MCLFFEPLITDPTAQQLCLSIVFSGINHSLYSITYRHSQGIAF